jgi:hypothetical protein
VFENRVLREIFGVKRERVRGGWKKNWLMRSFMVSPPHQT